VPRPIHRPVEYWQPNRQRQPARARFHGATRHQGGSRRGCGHDAGGADHCLPRSRRPGGEGTRARRGSAETREQAIREITPIYEEQVKMFAPLGFVPGLTPDQIAAVARRGGWAAAGVPTVEHYPRSSTISISAPGSPAHRGSSSTGSKASKSATQGCSTSLSATPLGRPKRSCSSSFNGSPRKSCRHSNCLADREIFCSRIHAVRVPPHILAVARRARPADEG
jgi:hypothetical protein